MKTDHAFRAALDDALAELAAETGARIRATVGRACDALVAAVESGDVRAALAVLRGVGVLAERSTVAASVTVEHARTPTVAHYDPDDPDSKRAAIETGARIILPRKDRSPEIEAERERQRRLAIDAVRRIREADAGGNGRPAPEPPELPGS